MVPEKTKTNKYKDSLAKKMHQIIAIIGNPSVWEWETKPERTFEELHAILVEVDI